MTDQAPEGTGGSAMDPEEVNTGGAGNKDLTGQAREVVEGAEDSPTGPTPGGG